ncbi:MAG TPA: hypothetical protein VF022_11555 [Rhodanobacteraceae bacterium]|jgi:hypothetical protein
MRTIGAMDLPPDASKPNDSHELRFESRGDYLRAEVSGPGDSLQVSLAYWCEIAQECERRDVRALLVVDLFENEPLEPAEVDQVIEAMRDSYMRCVRVAYCESNSAAVPQAEYGELTAREAGFSVRVFASEHEAELWLRYGES